MPPRRAATENPAGRGIVAVTSRSDRMTMQASERVLFRGKSFFCDEEPLEWVFNEWKWERPEFDENSTSCYRGYVGSWEVRDGDLYLTRIDCPTVNGAPYGLHDLFPLADPDGLFTDWVTDWLGLLAAEEQGPKAHDYQLAVHRGRVIAIHSFPVQARPRSDYIFHQANHSCRPTVTLTPYLDTAFPDEVPFIRALHINWADHLPRLVYADWLEERNDPRGELLRVDVELAKSPGDDDLLARRKEVLVTVKDWFWMKLIGCDPPRNEWGWEQRTW